MHKTVIRATFIEFGDKKKQSICGGNSLKVGSEILIFVKFGECLITVFMHSPHSVLYTVDGKQTNISR